MTTIALSARRRSELGRHARHLRHEGLIPAVLYGHRVVPMSLTVDERAVERTWARAGRTHLIDLTIDGDRPHKALLRELQISPRTGRPIHADFFAVNLHEKLTADVPVVLVGEAPAVSQLKVGTLLQTLSEVRVECLPSDLPAQISVDISGLTEVDQAITIGEIALPRGVVIPHVDANEMVVKVAPPRVEKAEEAAPEPAAEEPAAEER